MDIINPYYVPKNGNVFNIRRNEFESLETLIKQIVQPVEEFGFEIDELEIRPTKRSSGELARSLKQNLIIKIKKNETIIDLSMSIPKLIDKNYFIINGRKKIPLFQLFDIPVITRGKNIKISTNIVSMMITNATEPPHVKISFLGKNIPLFLLFLAYFDTEEVKTIMEIDTLDLSNLDLSDVFQALQYDLYSYYESASNTTQEDLFKEIGGHYTKYDRLTKGEDIIYALNLIPRIDPISMEFFEYPTILEQIAYVLKHRDKFDDTNFRNKRIRCIEYLITSKISKNIFDFCMACRRSNVPKFNIKSSQIMSECNVSDIVQFDFSINPLDELTKLTRTSLVGPSGFKKDNVPGHLRDISKSMFGRLCPVDTPDRENCGVLQNLLVNSKLDETLRFREDVNDKQPVSTSVCMVPFLEHDDQTRLQMSASQMRQGIMLKEFDTPMIASGCEGLYSKYTQFVKTAEKDGTVVYRDDEDNWIFIRYDDGSMGTFQTGLKQIYVQNLDYFRVYVNEGDRVKAGQIIAESNFVKDGNITVGKNLLTAVMGYYGHNYEDGIVISDRLIEENVLTSVHCVDLSFDIPSNRVLLSLSDNEYKPLPEPGDNIKLGQVYAKLKEIPNGPLDYYNIFSNVDELKAEQNIIVTSVDIFCNSYNSKIMEFTEWVENKIKSQIDTSSKIQRALFENFPKEEALEFIKDNDLDAFEFQGKYKTKGEILEGIHVRISGIFYKKIAVGDKVANRHGNKGVISTIIPHEQMPQLPDGRHVDICINPLGIISRMNIGQLFELHTSMALYNFKQTMIQMIKEGKDQSELKNYLLGFIDIVDNTEIKWYSAQVKEHLPEIITEEFVNNFNLIQPPFESMDGAKVDKLLKYTNTDYEYPIYDPVSKKILENSIACGYLYFVRMVHIASSRLAARGVGSYAKKTLQPLAGRKNKGGQRLGEMETACLIAHDVPKNLFEFMTSKSDCIDLKNKAIKQMIDSNIVQEESEMDTVSESVKLLTSYLTVLGVEEK